MQQNLILKECVCQRRAPRLFAAPERTCVRERLAYLFSHLSYLLYARHLSASRRRRLLRVTAGRRDAATHSGVTINGKLNNWSHLYRSLYLPLFLISHPPASVYIGFLTPSLSLYGSLSILLSLSLSLSLFHSLHADARCARARHEGGENVAECRARARARIICWIK